MQLFSQNVTYAQNVTVLQTLYFPASLPLQLKTLYFNNNVIALWTNCFLGTGSSSWVINKKKTMIVGFMYKVNNMQHKYAKN